MNKIQSAKEAYKEFSKIAKCLDKAGKLPSATWNMDSRNLKSNEVFPNFPLKEIAVKHGINMIIKSNMSAQGMVSYYWRRDQNYNRVYPSMHGFVLNMRKNCEKVFFHELTHIFDLAGRTHDRSSSHIPKEVIAEFTAWTIAESLDIDGEFESAFAYLRSVCKGKYDVNTVLRKIKAQLPRIQRVIDMLNADIQEVYGEPEVIEEEIKCKWTHKINGQFYIWSMNPIEAGKQVIVVSNSGKQEMHTIGDRVEFRFGGYAYIAQN